MLEEFLDDVIAKNVRHEGVCRSKDLVKDQLFFGRCGTLQLLLDKSGTMLILGEFDHVVG